MSATGLLAPSMLDVAVDARRRRRWRALSRGIEVEFEVDVNRSGQRCVGRAQF